MGTPRHVVLLRTPRRPLRPVPLPLDGRRRPMVLLRVRRARRIAQKALLGERS